MDHSSIFLWPVKSTNCVEVPHQAIATSLPAHHLFCCSLPISLFKEDSSLAPQWIVHTISFLSLLCLEDILQVNL